jgi:hypothetical protein
VSRGIGDRHLKQWVIAEPDTKVLRIKPEHELLILASDGLWDKVWFLFLYCLNPLKDVSTKLLIRFVLLLVYRLVIFASGCILDVPITCRVGNQTDILVEEIFILCTSCS